MKQTAKRILAAIMGVCMMSGLFSCAKKPTPDEPVVPGDPVIVGNVRVEPLSQSIVRIELKGEKGFEDRETYNIVNRDFTLLQSTVTAEGESTLIKTDSYTVTVPNNASSLEGVKVKSTDGRVLWEYEGMPETREFLPSPGDTPEAYVIADSPRIVPSDLGASLPASESEAEALNGWDVSNNSPDLYVLLPKENYRTLVKDFITLTGPTEMIPLKAFGLWYSKYSNINQTEALQDIDDFREHNFPLDYFGVDTDWRVGGREGYELNTSQWPNLSGFLETAHSEKNVSVYFNDHAKPYAGVMFDDNALLSDTNALSYSELKYRNDNLKKYLNMGLDMWWYDRNWPYSVISPFETMGISRDNFGMYIYQSIQQQAYPNRRPMIMGNIDGVDSGIIARPPNLTSHRYPVQWTGDTMCYMSSLESDIATMVNEGVLGANSYVTHDGGGHAGKQSGASYLRWVQFGSFCPVFRLHSSGSDTDRAPWLYSGAEDTSREYVNLRYRLLPLYYALAHENYTSGLPILRRLDIDYPGYAEAQDDSQYLLGENILVAPLTEYSDNGGNSSRDVFIPDGTWTNLFTGESFTGPQTVRVTCNKDTMPLFVRSGSVTATAREVSYIGEKDWSQISLDVYPSTVSGSSTLLYEDDTESTEYKNGAFRETLISTGFDSEKNQVTVTVGAASGSFNGSDSFKERTWTLRLHTSGGFNEVTAVTVNGKNTTVTKINKDASAYPFAGAGKAATDDVYEVTFTAKLTSETNISVSYATVPTETEIKKPVSTVSMSHKTETMLANEVTEGSADSIRFTADSLPASGTKYFKNVSSGEQKTFDASVALDSSKEAMGIGNGTLSFDLALTKGEHWLTLYVGESSATSRIEITDNSGAHVKIIDTACSSGLRQDKITVYLYAKENATVSVKIRKLTGNGRVGVFGATVRDAKPEKATKISCTSFISDAPAATSFSSPNITDWVHLGHGGSANAVTGKKNTDLLSDPIIVGNTGSLNTFGTAISFAGGNDSLAADNSTYAVTFENSVEFTVPASTALRELKIYAGVHYATNTVEIWDEAGSEMISYQFSHKEDAYKCITVQFSAEKETTLHVRLRRTYGRTGTICLAGYTLSEITQADLITSELRSLIEVYDSTYTSSKLKLYTEDTVNAYRQALIAAKIVSRKDPVTKEETDKVTADLKNAVEKLKKGSPSAGESVLPSNATASASSENSANHAASAAIDSNRDGSRWAAKSAGAASTDWLCIDLKKELTFDKILIYWESVSRNFKIQISNDGTNWTDVASDTSRKEAAGTRIETVTYFDEVTARYVRVYSTARTTDAFGGAYLSILDLDLQLSGATIEQTVWEKLAELTDNPVSDPDNYSDSSAKTYSDALASAQALFKQGETDEAKLLNAYNTLKAAAEGLVIKEYKASLNATATASQPIEGSNTADRAVDGKSNTRWASANGGAAQSLTLDLGSRLKISRVALFWESPSNAYTIEVSNDGVNWTEAAKNTQSVSAGTGTVNRHDLNGVEARYIRMSSTKGAPGLGTYLSLYEFEVYALNEEAI